MADNLLEHLAGAMYNSEYNYNRSEGGSLGLHDCREFSAVALSELGLPAELSLADAMRYAARLLENISGHDPFADAPHMQWSACALRAEANRLDAGSQLDDLSQHQGEYVEGEDLCRCSCGESFHTEEEWIRHVAARTGATFEQE